MNLKEKFMIALEKSWGLGSNSKWTKENKAKGQCGVSSLADTNTEQYNYLSLQVKINLQNT